MDALGLDNFTSSQIEKLSGDNTRDDKERVMDAEGWVGWPCVTNCFSLFASGSVDSSLVQSVPGWAVMSLTSHLLFALVRWGAFIKILISLSRAP